jgi:hypothetical protein
MNHVQGRWMMRSLAWPILGLALAFFTNGCATHHTSKPGLLADASTTLESVSDSKAVETELACEGPSTVCEVP